MNYDTIATVSEMMMYGVTVLCTVVAFWILTRHMILGRIYYLRWRTQVRKLAASTDTKLYCFKTDDNGESIGVPYAAIEDCNLTRCFQTDYFYACPHCGSAVDVRCMKYDSSVPLLNFDDMYVSLRLHLSNGLHVPVDLRQSDRHVLLTDEDVVLLKLTRG